MRSTTLVPPHATRAARGLAAGDTQGVDAAEEAAEEEGEDTAEEPDCIEGRLE
jgi:hypothetical protein